jgi:replicative DNA helicase
MSEKKEDQQDITQLINDKEFTQEDQTQMLKTMFPGRTDAELVKINRNFLKDAVPFDLSRLINEIKRIPGSLKTGFKEFDEVINIPNGAITIVTGPSKQGKSLFMMNILYNMTQIYKGKHFLYYNYQEAKKECEMKFINLAGEKPFDSSNPEKLDKNSIEQGLKTNFDIWKWKLKTASETELLKFASEDLSYKGLMNFLDVSSRIHIIESNYNVNDLIESIKLFKGPFIIGAVFIDFIQKIEIGKDDQNKIREEQLLIISENLRRFSNQLSFPLILGSQRSSHNKKNVEKSDYIDDSLRNLNGLEYDASLIIDISLEEKNKDTLYLKVLANRIGPSDDTKLKFDPNLLKITDIK